MSTNEFYIKIGNEKYSIQHKPLFKKKNENLEWKACTYQKVDISSQNYVVIKLDEIFLNFVTCSMHLEEFAADKKRKSTLEIPPRRRGKKRKMLDLFRRPWSENPDISFHLSYFRKTYGVMDVVEKCINFQHMDLIGLNSD